MPFLFDDDAIVANAHIRRLWPLTEPLFRTLGTPLGNRPLVSLSFAVNYAISRLEVWSYHAVNLAIHVLAGWLLLGLIRRTLAGLGHSPARAHGIALATSLLWTTHPLQTQSVTYIIQRNESLTAFWYLLTLVAAARAWPPRRRGWTAAAISACAFGMTCKPVMATAPLAVLLYDRVFLCGSLRRALRERRGLYTGLGATWLILVALLIATPNISRSAGFGYPEFSALEYARTQPAVLLHYLRLALWPDPLVLDYQWPPSTARDAWPACLALGAIVAGIFMLWRHRPRVALPAILFFLVLTPTSSIIPVADIAMEHRMYLPLAPIILLIVLGVERVLRAAAPAIRPAIAIGLLAGLTAVLVASTARRNQDYQSELAIWRDTVRKRPTNARARLDLGRAYSTLGRLDDAAHQYAEAIRLRPSYAEAHSNLGSILVKQGRPEDALTRLREAIRLKPALEEAHFNLGVALARLGRLDEAIASYKQALRLDPGHGPAHSNLGTTLSWQGRFAAAAEHYLLALHRQPDLPELHYNLGVVLAKQGSWGSASAAYKRALHLRPDFPEAHAGLAEALAAQAKIDEASAHLEAAVRAKPSLAFRYRALHRMLAPRADPAPIPQPGQPAAQSAPVAADRSGPQDVR